MPRAARNRRWLAALGTGCGLVLGTATPYFHSAAFAQTSPANLGPKVSTPGALIRGAPPDPEPDSESEPKPAAGGPLATRDSAVIAADAAQPAVIHYKDRVFRIAFNVEPADIPKIREVRLTRSSDLGGTWDAVAQTTPDRPSFSFKAPRDGEFWFAFQTIDQKNRPNPPSDAPIEPRLKVIVDTEAPTLLADPRGRQTSRANVSWEAHDDHLDLRTLRLEQKLADGSWRRIPIERPQASGFQVWNAETEQGFRASMTIADLAGNVRRIEFDVPASPNASPPSSSGVIATNSDESETPPSSRMPDPDEEPEASPPAPETPDRPNRTLVSDRTERPEPRPQPNPEPVPASAAPKPEAERTDAGESAGSASSSRILNDPFGPGAMATAANPFRPEAAPAVTAPAAKAPSGSGGRATIPTILAAGPRFPLQYEVENAGPDGPAIVELWITRDGGRTWGRLPEDPDRVSPYLVDLGGEGIFGLTLVTRSASGAGDLPPAPSSAPEMWVEVDSTAPQIQLETPSVGVGEHAGKVAITWRVNDAHLGSPCILLRWRPEDQPNAPWRRITEPLDNTGKYIWKVPEDVPPRFHIRIDAIDTLKNRGYADTLTSGPVVLERSKPKGRIIGLDPSFRSGAVIR